MTRYFAHISQKGPVRYGDVPGSIGVLEVPDKPMPIGEAHCLTWDKNGPAAATSSETLTLGCGRLHHRHDAGLDRLGQSGQAATTAARSEGGEKESSLNSASLTPKPLASSVYVHVLEAPSPLKRLILVMSFFPSLDDSPQVCEHLWSRQFDHRSHDH